MILDTLLKTGIDPSDAVILEDAFGNSEPGEFLKGLETIAIAISDGMEHDIIPSVVEPWRMIATEFLLQKNDDLLAVVEKTIEYYDVKVRGAVLSSIHTRKAAHDKWKSDLERNSKGITSTADYIRALDKLGYKFKLNLCDDHIEVNSVPLTDFKAAEIRTRMASIGYTKWKQMEDAYNSEALRNAYHPVKDYLKHCQYDGEDHIGKLAECFDDEYQMFDIWLKKWLVGAVAKVMSGKQNRMLVLDGPQGIGKSSFVRWLASGLPHFFYEGAIDTFNRKDTEVKLMNTWIWEVSELGGTMARAEMNALKAILSQQIVTVRKAYGRHETSKNALASFIGTINNEAGFLNDFTGSRRYMISKVRSINWDYEKIEIWKVWGQALFLYDSGFRWNLDDVETEKANEINETYQIEDVTQSAIRKYFDIDHTQVNWFLSTFEIAQVLEEKGLRYGSSNSTMLAVGRACAALGLQKMRKNANGQRVYGYCGIQEQFNPGFGP